MAKKHYDCGLGPAFEAVGGKWKVAVLWELAGGALRFGELKRSVPGVTEKMLIQQLRELERDCLVTRTVFHEVPPRVEYALTEWGVSLNKALAPIANWGEAFAQATGRYPRQDAVEPSATTRAKAGSATKPKTARGRRGS
ncbi:winged helix-turn-helix transcriptional regulator [Pseudoxanthomonas wuyuanensis]